MPGWYVPRHAGPAAQRVAEARQDRRKGQCDLHLIATAVFYSVPRVMRDTISAVIAVAAWVVVRLGRLVIRQSLK
jgi:hypothetical protein